MEAASVRAPGRKKMTARGREERRLAWTLCAPAVTVMLLVTAYPIGYAIYLSLQKFDLRFPDDKEFVGLANYHALVTDAQFWRAATVTVVGQTPHSLTLEPPEEGADFNDGAALPDGRGILLTEHTGISPGRLAVWDGTTLKTLLAIEGANLSSAVHSETGHLLFERSDLDGLNAGIERLNIVA